VAKNYLVDTSIIVDYLRGSKKAASFLNLQNPIIISVITATEIYQGAKNKKELNILKELINRFKVIPINVNICQLALTLLENYTLSHHLLILDSLIAATVIKNKLTLVTGNYKHFSMIKKLQVQKWSQEKI